MLDMFQDKHVCGVLITRRMAKLMLSNITIPALLTNTKTYYDKLVTHYDDNISNEVTAEEPYVTENGVDTSKYENPFDTLLSTITSI